MARKLAWAGILWLLVFVSACGEAIAISGVEDRPPIDLIPGQEYTGTVKGTQPYRFDVPGGAILTLEIASSQGQVTYRLSNAAGQALAADSVTVQQARQVRVVVDGQRGGEYTVEIGGLDAGYRLRVSLARQNDGGSSGDAPETLAEAVAVGPGTYTGNLGQFDRNDAYSIDVPAHGVLRFSQTNDAASPSALTTNLWAGMTPLDSPVPTGAGDSFSFVSSLPEATIYGVVLSSVDGVYAFEVEVELPDDAGSGGDAGDRPAKAFAVEVGGPYEGLLSQNDTDCYGFTLAGAARLNVEVSIAAPEDARFEGRAFVEVRQLADNKLSKSTVVRYGETRGLLANFAPGGYSVCIQNDSPLARYTFSIAPPEN